MKKDTRWISYAGVGTLALIMVAGCTGGDQTGDGQTADSPEGAKIQNNVDTAQDAAGNAVGATGNAVANGAAKAGSTVVNAASNAGNAVANTAQKAGQATVSATNKAISGAKNLDDAATVTPMIKTAFGANAALKGSNINVSTTDKNVRLDGTVKTPAQKAMAGNIAKQKAPGYTIANNLKVG